MHCSIKHSAFLKTGLASAMFLLLLVAVSGCNLNQGAGERMVNLQQVSDDQKAELENLSEAITRNKQNASLYSRRAKLLLQQAKPGEALTDINEAIRLDKKSMANLFLKAQALRALGRVKEALPLALQAERNSYQSAALYILLSDLYLQLNQPKQAEAATKRALELAPESEYALYYRGKVAAVTGDTTRAVHHYRQALQEEPAFTEARRELAGALVQQKQYGEARQQLNIAMKQAPRDALLWDYQGQLYQDIKKPDSALWSYRTALKYVDTLRDIHYNVGLLLFAKGEYPEAITHLERAAADYQNSATFTATLASAYERTGQNLKALEQYQRLVALQPGYSYAAQHVSRIKARLMRPVPVAPKADTASINY